ncbi:uncharacterized protein LOC124656501 [Lolium rigidum]|nr:uncharacterized protein LOC124656501 [Lolium rigidum]
MPRTSGVWLLVAMVCLAATAARAYDDMADVTTYWQKRTQETRFKRGGPLTDLVNAAARYHQELNGNKYGGGRYLLQEKAEAPAADSTASTATETATSTASTGAAAPPVVQNTLADHEMIGA